MTVFAADFDCDGGQTSMSPRYHASFLFRTIHDGPVHEIGLEAVSR